MQRPDPRATIATLVTLSVLAAACGGSPGAPDASPPVQPPPVVEESVPAPGTDTTPTPPPRPEPAPDRSAPEDCDAEQRERITATVSTQVEAFASEDFDGAYAMTSPFFQQRIAREAFEALIRDDYPELVGNDGHRFDTCQVRNRRAFVLVGVRSATDELVLRYDLSDEDDGWRIDGAIRVTGILIPPEQQV
jgi:hypothetical protein